MPKDINLVQLKDKAGKIHEVPRKNANDLIQHLGWKRLTDDLPESMDDRASKSPRTKTERTSKVAEARKAYEDGLKEKAAAEAEKKPAKKSKKVKDAVEDDDVQVEDIPTFDEQADLEADVEADLDALEAEEEERGKH